MSVLSDNFKKILEEIELKISNPEEREFVKQKVIDLSTLFLDVIDNLSEKTEEKISKIEKKQKEIENQMEEVTGAINEMENGIFDEEQIEESDFEIVCPYCNCEFIAEIEGKSEIECPECHNEIELEWNEENDDMEEDFGCTGHCSACGGCSEDEYEDNFEEDNSDDM